MTRKFFLGFALSCAALLSACGGGGADAGTPPWPDGEDPGQVVTDVTLTLSGYSMPNSGTDVVSATVTTVDANRNVIPNTPVTFTVDQNAIVSTTGAQTNADGQVIGTVSLGADRSNRAITVTATVGTIVRTATFQVTGAKITSSLSLSVAPASTNNQISYRVTDVNSNPIVGTAIVVTAPGLATATGVTDTTGSYLYSYSAPASTGSLTLTAVAGGAQDIQTVQIVAADGTVPAAQGTVLSSSVTANPDVVPVNTDTSSNQSQLRALFVGSNNAPIKNIRVRFDLNGDANSIGGTFTSGTSLLYSNENGIVTGAYRPGTRSSPTDGVTVRACWDYVDFAVGSCPNSVQTVLTVTAEALSVTIGTDELIEDEASTLTYLKKFVVSVVDAAGNAKAGVTITPKLDLPGYYKGRYVAGIAWTQVVTTACANEDVDRNGVRTEAEDINGNGKLEPRAADASISLTAGGVTGSNGLLILQLRYPKNVASWDDFIINVTATGVAGTEGSATYAGTLPLPAGALTNVKADPAFVLSPYGSADSCSDPK